MTKYESYNKASTSQRYVYFVVYTIYRSMSFASVCVSIARELLPRHALLRMIFVIYLANEERFKFLTFPRILLPSALICMYKSSRKTSWLNVGDKPTIEIRTYLHQQLCICLNLPCEDDDCVSECLVQSFWWAFSCVEELSILCARMP